MPALRPEQLSAQLAGKLAPLYVVHGDEPLLVLEAADAVRAAARKAGCTLREILVAERGFDWSQLRDAGASQSLFGERKVIDLRIPSGKPGTQGAEALIAHCGNLPGDAVTLITLPRIDRTGQSSNWFKALAAAAILVEIYPVERAKLPAWIGARLARQGQRSSEEGLRFLADRVEGNLLAAHQEVSKLALLAPPGDVDLDTLHDAVANVARFDAYAASAALLGGELARYARIVEGLRAEGEASTLAVWCIGEDLRALGRIQDGLREGRDLDAMLRDARVWGPRQAAMRVAARRVARKAVAQALRRAAAVDRAGKGLERTDPWEGLLALGLEFIGAAKARPTP